MDWTTELRIEERIRELEDITIKIIHSKQQRENRLKKKKKERTQPQGHMAL